MKRIILGISLIISTIVFGQEIATTESGKKVILNKNGTFIYTKEVVNENTTSSTIKGVVTYYFNKYQGNKPDLGANVVIVDSTQIKNFDYKLWNDYYFGKSYRDIYSQSKQTYSNYTILYEEAKGDEKGKYKKEMENSQKDVDRYTKELEKYNSETEEKFKNIDKTLFPTLFQFLSGKDPFVETTVDNNGSYTVNVKPGVYYVYMKSKNRKGLTVTDISGCTYIDKVKVSANQNKDVSYNFDL